MQKLMIRLTLAKMIWAQKFSFDAGISSGDFMGTDFEAWLLESEILVLERGRASRPRVNYPYVLSTKKST